MCEVTLYMLLYLLQQMMGLIGIFVLTCDAKVFLLLNYIYIFLLQKKKPLNFSTTP